MGKTYGFTVEGWIRKLTKARDEEGNLLFVAEEEGRLAGFAWVHTHGAFLAAPYLRFIAVNPSFQGRGVGTLLLKEFEEQTRNLKKDWFLLVSEFNIGAQQFYEKHGYQRVGALPGFAKEGITEVIMVKKHERRN
ncbi:GNAT family N-acetyltransferase [Sphaerochaeta sp.]|uniref:GNAT family N-acetyltransferase n=1 Tax=Sphaerochaeta sp. TaxID=1972642 RepID=UPI003D0FFE3E